MDQRERAQRYSAWAWAAETLGIEATRERIRGLVDVTASVRLADLQPAIAEAIAAEERGFLPAPGLVMKIGKKFAARRYDALHAARRDRDRREALLGSGASPASPEQLDEIRQRIAQLAGAAGDVKASERAHGWRPANAIKSDGFGSKGIESVRNLGRVS